MPSGGANIEVDEVDDFTYTEDPSGNQVKVPVASEYVFKVVVVGDYSVGKTSLIKRMLATPAASLATGHGSQARHTNDDDDAEDSGGDDESGDDVLAGVAPTVGTDFYSLALPSLLPGISVRLQIWDTAGLEKYAAKYENTFRNASFVICVFDVTSAGSLHNVVERHLSTAAEHVPDLDQSNVMVVANKIDIVADLANNTSALRDARKRAQSPETAFVSTNDEDTATNTADGAAGEFFTSTDGVDKDAIVTAQAVQSEVFNIFGDVHYAEVSAKTKAHVGDMLRSICYALLRNSSDGTLTIPSDRTGGEAFARTVLPLRSGLTSPTRTTPVPSLSPVTAPPAPGGAAKKEAAKPTPAPPAAAAWSTTGAFAFDMAPAQFGSTSVYSPMEGTDDVTAHPHDDAATPLPGHLAPDSPLDKSNTMLPAPRDTGKKPVDTSDVHVDVNPPKGAKSRPALNLNEDPNVRKEQEQAEMKALLSRVGQRKAGQDADGGGDSAPAATAGGGGGSAAWRRSDADKMEDDVAEGRDTAMSAPSVTSTVRPGITSSILDSMGLQDGDKKKPDKKANASDSDEDGRRLQTSIKDRFAQIEHDVRQDAAWARQRAKTAKKQEKAKSKCNCVVM